MATIETLRASTLIHSSDTSVTTVTQTITGLFLSIQLSNPDHDLDWSTVNIYTEDEEIETRTFVTEKWLTVTLRRLYVEVKGVKRG